MSPMGIVTGAIKEAGAAPPSRLRKAAHEFEAQMMKQLLEPLNAENGLTGDDGDGLGSAGALGEFASEALGRALSERGGLGIADRIVRSLAQYTHDVPSGTPRG